MENLEEKLLRYRENIPYREVQEAFKVFYETRDEKIRENLIMRYMPVTKRIIEKLEIREIENEDLVQMAYEILIKCIDKYNPYNKTLFSIYLVTIIKHNFSDSTNVKEFDISLTNMEIYSNDDLEKKVIYDIIHNQLFLEFVSLLSQKNQEVLKLIFVGYHWIDIAKELNLSKQTIERIKKDLFKIMRKNRNIYDMYNIFYSESDSIEDSHEVYTRSLK